MQKIILNGVTAYITDVVKWGDELVYKRGFCLGERISLPENFNIEEDKKPFLPNGLDVIDLIYYGNLKKIGKIFISDWYDKYRLKDSECFKIFYDAQKRFGGKFFTHSHQTCVPFVQLDNCEIFFGLYCLDIEDVIAKEKLSDICYNEDEFCLHSQNIIDLINSVMS